MLRYGRSPEQLYQPEISNSTPEFTVEGAFGLAIEVFDGMYDKDGRPAVLHSLRVCAIASDPVLVAHFGDRLLITALLHDVLEDTHLKPRDLRAYGVADEIIRDLKILKWDRKHKTYDEYIENVKQGGDLVRVVKLADNAENRVPARRLTLTPEKREMADRKYNRARYELVFGDVDNIDPAWDELSERLFRRAQAIYAETATIKTPDACMVALEPFFQLAA